MPMFTKAITRKPAASLKAGLTEANLGTPDIDRAMSQHQRYIETLGELQIDVTVLESSDTFPDSVFVEDVAVCVPGCAVITRPGAPSRLDETSLIEAPINAFFETIERIEAPGTLDGGDVMIAGHQVFVGLSSRTNAEGARQLIEILQAHGFTGVQVPLSGGLHLKSGISHLENSNLLATDAFADHPMLREFYKIRVPADEAYAANSLWINGTVLIPDGHDETRRRIEKVGYDTIAIDVSEFQKLDGGLSCLSLRF